MDLKAHPNNEVAKPGRLPARSGPETLRPTRPPAHAPRPTFDMYGMYLREIFFVSEMQIFTSSCLRQDRCSCAVMRWLMPPWPAGAEGGWGWQQEGRQAWAMRACGCAGGGGA